MRKGYKNMEIGSFCSRHVSATAIFIVTVYFTSSSKALAALELTKSGRTSTAISVGDEVVSRELEVNQGEFSFLVALLFSKRQECAGTLLSKTLTLTSCHCLLRDKWERYIRSPHRLEEAKNVNVHAGTVDLLSTSGQIRRARTLIVHPKCARNTTFAEYDFGMIIVDKPFVLCPFRIAFFTLPDFRTREVAGMLNGENVPCISMGWGSGLKAVPNLRKFSVVLQASSWCRQNVENRSVNEAESPKFDGKYHICATGGKLTRAVCKGDNGAPLLCGAGRRKELLALTAAGLETNLCGKDVPFVYSRLDIAGKWITGVMVASKSNVLISNAAVMILVAHQAVLKVGS